MGTLSWKERGEEADEEEEQERLMPEEEQEEQQDGGFGSAWCFLPVWKSCSKVGMGERRAEGDHQAGLSATANRMSERRWRMTRAWHLPFCGSSAKASATLRRAAGARAEGGSFLVSPARVLGLVSW